VENSHFVTAAAMAEDEERDRNRRRGDRDSYDDRRDRGPPYSRYGNDVHHGNGIQDLTYDDPQFFYLSIHRASSKQVYFYPGTGTTEETVASLGVGSGLIIVLKRGGMGNVEYGAAFT
jgi:hypothetical protein